MRTTTVEAAREAVEFVRNILAHVRELIRHDLEVARAEIGEEAASARAGALAIGGAVFAGLQDAGEPEGRPHADRRPVRAEMITRRPTP